MVSPGGVTSGRGSALTPTSGVQFLPTTPVKQALPSLAQPHVIPQPRALTRAQVDAIRTAMHLFVEDDIARGNIRQARLYCDACECARPAAGFIQYDRYAMCNRCATEYEVGRARGQVGSAGQYVRDKHFGDGALYELSD